MVAGDQHWSKMGGGGEIVNRRPLGVAGCFAFSFSIFSPHISRELFDLFVLSLCCL